MALARVIETASVEDPDCPGNRIALIQGEFFEDDHSVVKAYPKFFRPSDGSPKRADGSVESATAAPGEKRGR